MTELKCPFCGNDTSETIWEEANAETYCSHCDTTGDTKLWQELITTRKALDVAIEQINGIKKDAVSVGIGFFMTAAINALNKINEIKGGK